MGSSFFDFSINEFISQTNKQNREVRWCTCSCSVRRPSPRRWLLVICVLGFCFCFWFLVTAVSLSCCIRAQLSLISRSHLADVGSRFPWPCAMPARVPHSVHAHARDSSDYGTGRTSSWIRARTRPRVRLADISGPEKRLALEVMGLESERDDGRRVVGAATQPGGVGARAVREDHRCEVTDRANGEDPLDEGEGGT